VSVASAEKSFSSLKRLKTDLRHRVGQGRLSGFALLNINKYADVNIAEAINRFANNRNRGFDFLLK
jgi:hypothetical protein